MRIFDPEWFKKPEYPLKTMTKKFAFLPVLTDDYEIIWFEYYNKFTYQDDRYGEKIVSRRRLLRNIV